MKNKLLYLSSSVIPSQSANSVHVMKMCQAFNKYYNVDLLCYTTENECNEDDIFSRYGIINKFKISPLYIKRLRGKFFQKIFQILKILKSYNKNTMIYGRDGYSVYLAALLGYKVYYESHGLPISKLYTFIEKSLFKHKNFKKLIVISDKLKELYLTTNNLLNNDNIKVLHDGADELDLSKKGTDLGTGFHIGYIGSLYYEGRGVDVILEVAKLNPDFHFHLVGGKDEEVKYWQQKAIKNIKFHGFLPHNEASQYLLSFDVVLMPYQKNLMLADMKVNTSSWMSPMKMFEYMSAKKAIVSSSMPVIREVLNKNNSILVEPNRINEWSDAVNILFKDCNLRNKIANNSYNDFKQNYTWLQRAESIKCL
ncbi:glycosyltransferase [bacterium]|jgi:glycosyltransferase involved in cell wall biosynthesis|nr:glycosyltransferase [bacterium]